MKVAEGKRVRERRPRFGGTKAGRPGGERNFALRQPLFLRPSEANPAVAADARRRMVPSAKRVRLLTSAHNRRYYNPSGSLPAAKNLECGSVSRSMSACGSSFVSFNVSWTRGSAAGSQSRARHWSRLRRAVSNVGK